MDEIATCYIGRDIFSSTWWISLRSPLLDRHFYARLTDIEAPYPAKNFTRKQVEELRDYLNDILTASTSYDFSETLISE